MENIVIGGIYKHFKGNMYHVLGIAHHSETLEDMVIYRALYGKHEIWVRPLDMFVGVTRDGKKRFEYTGEKNEPKL